MLCKKGKPGVCITSFPSRGQSLRRDRLATGLKYETGDDIGCRSMPVSLPQRQRHYQKERQGVSSLRFIV